MVLSNDERGWVMTSLSGIACVLGASIICVDIIIRQFPGKEHFRIQDSDTFLSASLSLSFGVMLFSALYSMLPHAQRSLQDGGFSPKAAAWILVACFIGGVVGIQFVSRILHHFIPSHVVDCEHTHEEGSDKGDGQTHEHDHHGQHEHQHSKPSRPQRPRKSSLPGHMHRADSEYRPSSRRGGDYFSDQAHKDSTPTAETEVAQPTLSATRPQPDLTRKPSFQQRLTSSIKDIVSSEDPSCKCIGPCYGYSEPCGVDCFKNVSARGGHRAPARHAVPGSLRPPMSKAATAHAGMMPTESTPLLRGVADEPIKPRPLQSRRFPEPAGDDHLEPRDLENGPSERSSATLDGIATEDDTLHKTRTNNTSSSAHTHPEHHHHHVPTNAFLSIGLQTSIAIALHKLPEGFITYATNHANPTLGVAVFLALFIHNITEGFAMALPLYLAINSRFKAMLVSFVLGGLSQPIGAGVAALWFHLAGHGNWAPSEGVYGGMFAVTAGIMASVALQLFSESLDLTHSRMLCMVGAFTGMGILGVSSALTA